MKASQNKIIIAPLNWGLGHATRCVPIINALLENNFTPIIASDGNALSFLRKEFSNLEYIEIPAYNISYHRNLKLGLLLQIPQILKAVREESKIINDFILKNTDVVGVISDNRFGVRSSLVPSVYITHQVNVLSGSTTFFTSYFHQQIIKKFDECWIPDNENSQFSGKLSSTKKNLNTKFIGVLTRFKKQELTQNTDVLIILSGIEPNRSFLEKKLISVFKNDTRNIFFVLGKIESAKKSWKIGNTTFYNYVLSHELQDLINASKIIICRSGYSSIMDLAVLGKKVFFIPTEQQDEQEYLASFLEEKKYAPFSKMKDFVKEDVFKVEDYKGLKTVETILDSDLFSLFERKRKL
ncbi:UDP-N-acetylglucosamine--N-acetylmuramyl-(pentapeptide) pyrophosphoryl-undecaprenol N-acetylglucosamine transferase [Polaribacter sp. 11A2H]|uniref:UDP-N-acetylglucosamine--N-acetylmuramyl- (pentapeptide) pyrophosphoryl-undecaprenol N-acetylglucosamine transferase n=1 Tax=Polaribacter sp. 11A2H TaxID=2687290 RepID=UPI0014096543|nr:UDP-N-acetylglucosamine--N-acetylmuramyl-(pentapeptide) pyrophosphoryl-undecaprenol N-acetylglucosamine transferase [Polaribacter sp. 11A2H]